jgi:hypothetical protein
LKVVRQSQRWIDEVEFLVHPKDGHRKIIAMIQAYIDESGIQAGAPICLVGGYFGGIGQWKRFQIKWQRILDKEGIEEFHAIKFWARNPHGERVGEYKEWSDGRSDKFLNALVDVIAEHRIHPVTSALVVGEFKKLSHNQRRFLTGGGLYSGQFKSSGCPSKPYFLPFQTCIVEIAGHAPRGGRAHYAFDLNKQFKGYAINLYKGIKAQKHLSVREQLGEIAFPTGIEAPPLQAADLLCYQAYLFAQKRAINPMEIPNPIHRRLIGRQVVASNALFLDKSGLDVMLDGIDIPSEPATLGALHS